MSSSMRFESFDMLGLSSQFDTSKIKQDCYSRYDREGNKRSLPANKIGAHLLGRVICNSEHVSGVDPDEDSNNDSKDILELSKGSDWLIWGLQEFLRPPPSLEHIQKRQEVYKFFASETRNKESQVISCLDSILNAHHGIWENCGGYTSFTAQEYFSILVHKLGSLAECLDNGLTGVFARDIKQLLRHHKFTLAAPFLDEQKGRVLVVRGKDYASWETRLVRVENDDYHVDLGVWEWKKRPYPDSSKHIKQINEFCESSGPLVYTLGMFYWHALIAREREKIGLSVCLPAINKERRFVIENAYPLGIEGIDAQNRCPVPIDFWYTPKENKVIIGGAHSGGKTILLETIDLYHQYGIAGLPLPCSKAEIPFDARLRRSYEKQTHKDKGGLESEIADIANTGRTLQNRDVYLYDEFLDTTRPEIGNRLQVPMLQMLGNTTATIIVVCHRIKDVPDSLGYRFVHPELIEIERERRVLVKEKEHGSYWENTGDREKRLIPTHKFLDGKPDPLLTARHAKEMWQDEKELAKEYQ